MGKQGRVAKFAAAAGVACLGILYHYWEKIHEFFYPSLGSPFSQNENHVNEPGAKPREFDVNNTQKLDSLEISPPSAPRNRHPTPDRLRSSPPPPTRAKPLRNRQNLSRTQLRPAKQPRTLYSADYTVESKEWDEFMESAGKKTGESGMDQVAGFRLKWNEIQFETRKGRFKQIVHTVKQDQFKTALHEV